LSFSDRRFRVELGLERFYERLPSDALLTMTMAQLSGHVRIDDLGNTAVYLGGGVVHARTNNAPMADSAITGTALGARVEQRLKRDMFLYGSAERMFFKDDMRATSARTGIRIGHFQAGLRVLDFNVGPPLYGPELAVGF
jgi:hypothetical protein